MDVRLSHLSLERMLGTAVVLATLDVKRVISKRQLALLLAKANAMVWERPPHRTFDFFYQLSKQLILGVEGSSSWLRLMQMTRLMVLQEPSGCFSLTPALAMLCRAGIMPGDSVVAYLPQHNTSADSDIGAAIVAVLVDVMPRTLATACLAEGGRVCPNTLWATLLAIAAAEQHQLTGVVNPGETDPAKRITVCSEGRRWLEAECGPERSPAFQEHREAWQAAASALVKQWKEEFDVLAGEQMETTAAAQEAAKLAAAANAPPPTLLQRARKSAKSFQRGASKRLMVGLSAHAIFGIMMTKPSDGFSLGDKMFVQVNVCVTMLTFAVGFYYSKSTNCCDEKKAFLGCNTGRFAECMGYTSCIDLNTGAADLPEELHVKDFACLAFPQTTILHRLVVVLIMVACLVPVQSLLGALFQNPPAVTKHIGTQETKEALVKKLNKRGLNGWLQGIAFGLYGLFVNISKLNKAVAVMLVALVNMLCLPAARVKVAVKRLKKKLGHLPQKAIDHLCGPEYVRRRKEREERQLLEALQPLGYLDSGWTKYAVLGFMWFMATWLLLTYGMLIRAIQGPDAEVELINAWGLALAIELFGKEGAKLLVVRNIVNEVQGFITRTFVADENTLFRWLDNAVSRSIANQTNLAADEGVDDDSDDDDDDFDEVEDIDQADTAMDMDVEM